MYLAWICNLNPQGKALKALYLYNIVTIDIGFTFGKVLLL